MIVREHAECLSYSWRVATPMSPSGGSSGTTIPVRSQVGALFVVFATPPPGIQTAGGEVLTWTVEWLERHVDDPLKTQVFTALQEQRVSLSAQPAPSLPPPPVELLRYSGLDELGERVLATATATIVVTASDVNAPPRVGMWSAFFMAVAIAERMKGVLFDPNSLRTIRLPSDGDRFGPEGTIAASRHIIVPFSVSPDSGLGWMTTKGLDNFGLPDLELRDIPPNLNLLSKLMNSVAQFLIESTMREVAETHGAATQLRVPDVIEIDNALVARAHGRALTAESLPASPVRVALRFHAVSNPNMPAIQVVPTSDDAADTGVWLHTIAMAMFGGPSDILWADTSADAMQEAHRRAVAELPLVKRKFADGLRPGETLYVKRGFDTSDGSQEFLWIVVNQWTGSQISGQVANQPRDVPDVAMGQRVVIEEPEVFDWELERQNGPSDGGYTTLVIQRDSQQ